MIRHCDAGAPAGIHATLVSIALAVVIAGCSDQIASPRDVPSVATVQVQANSNNSLSVVVGFTTRRADSARVLYRETQQAVRDVRYPLATPFYRLTGDLGEIVVLGLKPDTEIELVVEAWNTVAATSTSITYHTRPLPPALVGLHLDASGTMPHGFTLTDFTAGQSAFMIAFDSAGEIAWYREFAAAPGEAALDAEQRADGSYTLYVGSSTGWQPVGGRFYEVSPAGESLRTYEANAPYYTDPHELQLDFSNGSVSRVHMIGYDLRTLDLTSLGGRPEHLVAGHVIERLSPSGAVIFQWNVWDHFSLADWIFVPPGFQQMQSIDFDHPNSLVTDSLGNYIVSFASFGLIGKIDGVTGDVLWRFGGRASDFTIAGDPLGGFGIQHDARLLPNGNILFFDNGTRHAPQESRAVEYRLDPINKTATLVWEYRHKPAIFAPFAGSVQRLANGNTVVSFGANPTVVEVGPDGSVVWQGQVTLSGRPVPFFYRTARIGSLYHSGPM